MLVGLYLLALIWIECEVRLARRPSTSYARLFTRFLFSFGTFGLSLAGHYLYSPPAFILSLSSAEYAPTTTKEYIVMGAPPAVVLLWSLQVGTTLSQHPKSPGCFSTILGLMAPVLILVTLFITTFFFDTFWDLVDVLLGMVAIYSLPMVVFTVYCIYGAV